MSTGDPSSARQDPESELFPLSRPSLGCPSLSLSSPSIPTDPNTPKTPFLCIQEEFPTPAGHCAGTEGQSQLPEVQSLHAGALQPPFLSHPDLQLPTVIPAASHMRSLRQTRPSWNSLGAPAEPGQPPGPCARPRAAKLHSQDLAGLGFRGLPSPDCSHRIPHSEIILKTFPALGAAAKLALGSRGQPPPSVLPAAHGLCV